MVGVPCLSRSGRNVGLSLGSARDQSARSRSTVEHRRDPLVVS